MAVITIRIYVSEIENVLLNFNKMQIQRSKLGDPYDDAVFITSAAAQPPVVTGTVVGGFPGLNGKDLTFRINGGDEQSVTFTTADPISVTNAVNEINTAIDGLTASNDGANRIKLTGDLSGTGGTIEITGGSAAVVLGFSLAITHGTDARIELLEGITEYVYSDLSGEASNWYRTRFYNSTSGTFGSWSDWIQGSTGSTLPSGGLIIGKAQLTDITGTALSGAKISLINVYNPLVSNGYFVAGGPIQIETDVNGRAETTLVKGMMLDVVVEGTSIIRRIQVPDEGTEFDLMDEDLVQDDALQIQVPDLPSAVRRS